MVKMFVLVCIAQARVCDEVCLIPCHARFVMCIGDAMAWVTSFSLIWLPDHYQKCGHRIVCSIRVFKWISTLLSLAIVAYP